MLITHEVDIDLVNPGPTPRVQVKQGDAMSRNIRVNLFTAGKPWSVSGDVSAVIRYCAYDADGHTVTHGMYDMLEDGSQAYVFAANAIEIMPHKDMMAHPGLVNVDVLLAEGERKLATFNIAISVNRAPAASEN